MKSPTYFVKFPGNLYEWNTVNYNRRNTLSTIPEESSCLNSDSNSRPCTPAIKNSQLTLDDFDEDEENYLDETSFNSSQSSFGHRASSETSAWTHNPNAYGQSMPNTRRNGRGRLPRPNYRDLPHAAPASRSSSNNSSQRSRSNMSNKSYNSSDHHSMGKPTVVQIHESDNRVTTKVKATFAMEVEYSHPCAPCPY